RRPLPAHPRSPVCALLVAGHLTGRSAARLRPGRGDAGGPLPPAPGRGRRRLRPGRRPRARRRPAGAGARSGGAAAGAAGAGRGRGPRPRHRGVHRRRGHRGSGAPRDRGGDPPRHRRLPGGGRDGGRRAGAGGGRRRQRVRLEEAAGRIVRDHAAGSGQAEGAGGDRRRRGTLLRARLQDPRPERPDRAAPPAQGGKPGRARDQDLRGEVPVGAVSGLPAPSDRGVRQRAAPEGGAVRRAVLALLVLASGGWSWDVLRAPDPDVERGNQAYREGRYAEAIERYEAAEARGESPALHFDKGSALYKLGEAATDAGEKAKLLDRAEEELARAAESHDPRLKSRAYHNLGNTHYLRQRWDE